MKKTLLLSLPALSLIIFIKGQGELLHETHRVLEGMTPEKRADFVAGERKKSRQEFKQHYPAYTKRKITALQGEEYNWQIDPSDQKKTMHSRATRSNRVIDSSAVLRKDF